jgi:Bacterial membrane protein YfhO
MIRDRGQGLGIGGRGAGRLYVYGSLLAVVVLFFHKPLFSPAYSFPWDFRAVQLPLITFLRDELSQGRFALWNPYNYGGYPVYANIQACFFHPLVFASALLSSWSPWLSLPILLEWSVVLQVWMGGMAAYGLFRAIGLGAAPAWAGAVMFETGSYFASRAEHIDSMMAAAWMPLAWLAVWKLRERLRMDWLAVLAAALGLSIWGGFPQATVAVFGSTLGFAALLAALRMARASVMAWAICACVLGILLAAVPFIPTTQLTELSVAKYRGDYLGTGGGLYWQSLVSLIAPDHYNIFDISRFKGPWDPTFLYLYSSIGGLILAMVALAAKPKRATALFAVMLGFGMLWMLGDKTFVWRALYPLLPEQVRIGIHPEYTYCIFSLSIAGLAAIGLDALRIPNWTRWAIAVVIAGDLFLVGSGRPMNVSETPPDPGDELRGYVNRNIPPWRFDTVDASMDWTNEAPVLRAPSAAGISPMALENAIQLRLFLHDGYRWGWNYPLEKLDSPIVDLLNVRYIVVGGEGVRRMAAVAKFRHIGNLAGNELFENTGAYPRFFLVHQIRVAGSLDEARRFMTQVDLRQTAILDQKVDLAPDGGDGEVQTLQYQPNVIELSVRSSSSALLVLSETYYPGWKAWVDDRPTPIYQTDIALRGIAVPAGAHRVRLEFHPAILPISLCISLGAAILLAFSVFLHKRRVSHDTIELNGK